MNDEISNGAALTLVAAVTMSREAPVNLKTLRENLRSFTVAGRLVLHTYTSPRRNAWSAPVPATPRLERVPIADIVPHGDELHVYLDTWPVQKP